MQHRPISGLPFVDSDCQFQFIAELSFTKSQATPHLDSGPQIYDPPYRHLDLPTSSNNLSFFSFNKLDRVDNMVGSSSPVTTRLLDYRLTDFYLLRWDCCLCCCNQGTETAVDGTPATETLASSSTANSIKAFIAGGFGGVCAVLVGMSFFVFS